MTIKFEGIRYRVSVGDKITIILIQIKLKVIRLIRSRKFFGIESLVMFLALTALWMIYALVVHTIECNQFDKTTIIECLWEIKEEYISTVIIVIAMRVCSKVLGNRQKLKMQHRSYYDLMSSADNLFEPMLGNFVLNYMAFYNDEMWHGTIDFIRSRIKQFEIDESSFYRCIRSIVLELDSIRNQYYSGNIIVSDEELFILSLNKAFLASESISIQDVVESQGNIIFELSTHLLLLIDEIRGIWRIDINDRNKIISIIYRNNKEIIEDSFYLRMHVLSVDDIFDYVQDKGW